MRARLTDCARRVRRLLDDFDEVVPSNPRAAKSPTKVPSSPPQIGEQGDSTHAGGPRRRGILACCGEIAARGGAEWREVVTAHIVLRTDLDAEDAREAAQTCEALYSAIRQVGSPPKPKPQEPIQVVVFARQKDYTPIAPRDGLPVLPEQELHTSAYENNDEHQREVRRVTTNYAGAWGAVGRPQARTRRERSQAIAEASTATNPAQKPKVPAVVSSCAGDAR